MDPHNTLNEDQQFWNLELFVAVNYGLKRKEITEEEITEKVKDCLCNGADIDAVNHNDSGNTALHVAIRRHNKQLIKFLLENGARIDIENSQGLTALTLAQKLKCQLEIINLLLNYTNSITNKVHITYWSKNQLFWSKLRKNSEIAVLEVNSVELSPDFLQQVDFYDAIDAAGNLFFVDVIVSDTDNIDKDFIISQLKRLNKHLIIQCSSIIHTSVYCKVSGGEVNVINLSSSTVKYDKRALTEKLSSEGGFGIDLIVEALKLNLVGNFETERKSLLKVRFDLEKYFDGGKLIDYAIKYGDVLTVRLLSLSNWNLSKLNSKKKSTLSITVEYGNIQKLAAVLRVEFPIYLENNISIPKETVAHFHKCKKQMLQTAVKAGNDDVISFLIRCGVKLDADIIELAWDSKRFEVVLNLLKSDCVFPSDFDLNEIGENDASFIELRTFVEERDHFHSLIEEGDLERVKEFVKLIAPSKLYLNKDNRSALYRALKSKRLNVFVWLKSELKADFTNDYERTCLGVGVLDSATDALVPHFVPIENAHILHLVAKSRCHQHYAGFKEHIESIYTELNSIPQISTVFKVLQFCDQVDIIYDFDKDSIVDVSVASSESDKGLCEYKAGRIYIGAKVDKRELLGTIAHELTHLAMQTVYDNDCKPYKLGDSIKDSIDEIIKEIRNNSIPVTCIIRRVFSCYGEGCWPSELIVRVNHMLAYYGLKEGFNVLEGQAKSLLEYYQEYVTPCFETFIRESHLIKPRNSIKVLNDYAGIIGRIDESTIRWKEPIYKNMRQAFGESEVQIAVVTSTSPFLSTMSVYQSLKEIIQQQNTFIIYNFDGYLKQRIEINQAFYSDVCKFLILLCESIPDKNSLSESLKRLAQVLWKKSDKKVIFIMENCVLSNDEVNDLVNLSLIVYPDVEYTLGDVRVESAKLLLDQRVSFQCGDANIKLSSLINEEHYKLVDAQTLLKLIKNQPIVIGKQIITTSKYHEHFYIDRLFSHKYQHHDDKICYLTEDQLLDQSNENRVIVISDSAGMGKTTVLTSLTCRLNERFPDLWVVRVDLNDYTKILDDEAENKSFEVDQPSRALSYFVDRLLGSRVESRLETDFERNLLLHFLQHNEDRLVVMFDGFDEIKERHQNVIRKVLVALKSSKVKQLWVTTRPHMRETLENTLHHLSYTLQPFSETEKVNFLMKFWRRSLFVEPEMATVFHSDSGLDKLSCFAEALIELISKSISGREMAFTGVPLQLKMVAECFVQNVKEFCLSDQTQPHLPQKLQLNVIFQMFFTRKYAIFQSEKNNVDFSKPNVEAQCDFQKESFLNNHRIASLFINLDDKECEILLTKDELNSGVLFINEIFSNKLNAGIIDLIIEGKPRFVHSTFAEYLTAEFLVNLLAKEAQSMRRILLIMRILYKSHFKFVRAFIDCYLAEKTIADAVVNQNGRALRSLWSVKPKISQLRFFLSELFRDGDTNSFFPHRLDICHSLNIAAFEGNANLANFLLNCFGNQIRAKLLKSISFYKMQPLETATKYDNLEVVKVLVEHGADVNARGLDKNPIYIGFNALLLAAYNGNANICEWLINNGADINATVSKRNHNFKGRNVLHLAVEGGNLNVVKVLRNYENFDFSAVVKTKDRSKPINALDIAAFYTQWDTIKMIVSEGLINVNTDHSEEPVQCLAFKSGLPEMVRRLIDQQTAVTNGTDLGKTRVLNLAAKANNLEVVQLLVSKGDDVNAVDSYGQTSLHWASKWGSEQVVEFLLKVKDIDVNVVDNNNRTPLHLAVSRFNVGIVRMLVGSGADVHAVKVDGQTPLHVAAQWGSNMVVELLLKVKDVDVNVVDKNMQTPLHLSAFENKLQIVKVLVNSGANVNAVDIDGQTPLHVAAHRGSHLVVKFLLTVQDVDVNAVDGNGSSPLDLALMNGHQNIVEIITTYC